MGEEQKLLELLNQNLNTIARNQALIYHEIKEVENQIKAKSKAESCQ